MITIEDISIRLMKDSLDDYSLLSKWLSDESVLEFYEGRDNAFNLDGVIEKFKPRVLKEHYVTPCIIEYENTEVGYIQYYEIRDEEKKKYEYLLNEKIYGIDLFIGETKYWNSGIGTKAIKALIEYIKENFNANKIIIDPDTTNTRAIRCYEKCGFKKVKVLYKNSIHEGKERDNLLMEIAIS